MTMKTFLGADPEKPAVILGETGAVVTHGALDRVSSQLAAAFYAWGLRPGDHIAILMENGLPYFFAAWAAQRSGLYFTPINWHLTAEEAGYIIDDCGARVVVTSLQLIELAKSLRGRNNAVEHWVLVDGAAEGFQSLDVALGDHVGDGFDALEGYLMSYSSGTSGRPKGILRPFEAVPFGEPNPTWQRLSLLYPFRQDTVYLCPAPLYHAAPIHWSMLSQRAGGMVILMERFDAEEALRLIERHHVNFAQFVPTMFIRMLKLPDEVRAAFDLSSLAFVVHAAAPCPVDVKQAMMDWWGPIIHEYYAGSEGNGFVFIGPDEWLAHKGSVGKAQNLVILDETGEKLGPGEVGVIWFTEPARFAYHNDPEKTAETINPKGWSTLGDMGYLDEEGYLFLTDRKSHMIISGGVNIYPQEAENVLASHPAILDVAVIGVPNAEFGEEVKAVVQLIDPAAASPALAADIIDFCKAELAHFKCPRSVDFVESLPRLPTGKLLKRTLREKYWPAKVKI